MLFSDTKLFSGKVIKLYKLSSYQVLSNDNWKNVSGSKMAFGVFPVAMFHLSLLNVVQVILFI